MTRELTERSQTIWDRHEIQLQEVETELVRKWEALTDNLSETVAEDLAGQLQQLLEERRDQVRGEGEAIKSLYEAQIVGPGLGRIERQIFAEIVDPLMEQLDRDLSRVVGELRQEAVELLRSSEFEGLFEGMSFAKPGRIDEVIATILGTFAQVIVHDSDLYERISNRGEVAAAGGGVGALLGGVLGFFVAGPVGAVTGVAVGAVAGAGVGWDAGDDQLKLPANWPRLAAKHARSAVMRALRKQFLVSRSRLVDQPFSRAKRSVREECLAPVQREARNYLESLRSSLYDLRMQKETVEARIQSLTEPRGRLAALRARVEDLADEVELDLAAR